jgi:DNA-binding GntR family transcriptional regulator
VFSPVRHASLHSLIVRPLMHAIFSGELSGGTHLIEKDLAAQFQISSAPVRDALREIASMGLLELRPNRGAVVLPFDPDSLRGIYHVRMALESEATRLAVKYITPAEAAALEKASRDLLAPGPRDTAWSLSTTNFDEQFHEMIATRAGMTRLSLELRRYGQLAHLIYEDIREFQGYQFVEQEKSIHQHLAIIGALRQGDAELAARSMRDHLLYAAEGAVEAFFSKRTC